MKKQQLELDMKQQTGSKLGKESVKAVYCHPAYLTSMQNTSCKRLGWIAVRNINKSQICRWHDHNGRKWTGTKEPLEVGERGEWKTWLKTQHSKMKIMASGPITSWQIDGETMETMSDLIFLGSKVTVDGDWSHEIKRHLLLGRKAMTNQDSVLKSSHYFANKGSYSQSYGFSSSHVWMWELNHRKGWMPKNWCLWTVVLEKALKSPVDCKKVQPVHPKGDHPGC